jgi:hypothetical protein
MAFMTMLLILLPHLEIFQLAWELMTTNQRSTAQTERPRFAMVKELMEFRMLVAHHHFHYAMVFQELMDTQVLIAKLLHFQPVDLLLEDFQEETVHSELAQHHQVLQLLSKKTKKSQPALIDIPLIANQSALKVKPPVVPNQELQLHSQ